MPRPRKETSRIVVNYLRTIREKEYPNYMIAKRLIDDTEAYYKERSREEIIYTLNPRWLHRELGKEIKHEKVTVRNISRIIRGFLATRKLRYYTTTTQGGCLVYHVELNPQVVQELRKTDKRRY